MMMCRCNKRQEDFKSLEEYNGYLEDVECMSEWIAAYATTCC